MAPVNAEVVSSGYIKGGRLFLRNRKAFNRAVATLRDGIEVELAVTLHRATRSLQQNAFYWGVVIEAISDHTGYTPDEIHDLLKMKFIPKRLAVTDGNGEIKGEFVLGGSTRKMNKGDFGVYLESVRQWAAEDLGIYIPDPGEFTS